MPPLALAVLFLILGLAILVAEVFLPSGGVLAILTLAALGASIASAYRALWETNPEWFWAYCGLVVASVPATVMFGFWLLPRTPMGKQLMLEAPTPEEVDPYADDRAKLQALIGKRATAITPHVPGGLVEVDGARMHAEARGPLPEAGDAVEVVAAEGRRLIVRLAREGDTDFAAGEVEEVERSETAEETFDPFDAVDDDGSRTDA